MKKMIVITIFTSLVLASCGGKSENIVGYSCPMECEGDSIHPKQETCSVCEMDLEAVEKK